MKKICSKTRCGQNRTYLATFPTADGRPARRCLRIAALLGLTLCVAVAARAADLRILIPLYAYPMWYQPSVYLWDDVARAASKVPITAIINPASGPGANFPNSDYARGLADLAAGGVTIAGYVHSSYGARDLDAVKYDVDQYTNSPLVTAIFVDEAASETNELGYYRELYAHIHARTNFSTVIVNPGCPIAEEYLRQRAADTAVIFENQRGWSSYVPDAYVSNYPARCFSALVHSCADTETMRRNVDLSAHRNIGWIYVTDDILPNPWDTLPPYWSALIEHVAEYRNIRATAIAAANGGVTVTFTTVSNRTARVEWRDALSAADWTPLTGDLIPTGAVIEATDTGAGAAARFYRLRLLQP